MSTAELDEMRSYAEGVLLDTAVLTRYVQTIDTYGAPTQTWSTVDSYACSVAPEPFHPTEGTLSDRLTAEARWVITLPANTDVTAKDRLTVTGVVYEVIGVVVREAYELVRRVRCVTRK